jgi:hypothetical protein
MASDNKSRGARTRNSLSRFSFAPPGIPQCRILSMQLWTDYEGLTIDNAFPLRKLLMPEGRSAFFSTLGPNGEPTVLRLVECHFDEEEILARWRSVNALNHPNFLKFERFGQTELDGRPVVYAVFEKVDGNLAEVLDQPRRSPRRPPHPRLRPRAHRAPQYLCPQQRSQAPRRLHPRSARGRRRPYRQAA